MKNCETCKWRSEEIGYYSPCPSHDKHEKEVPFLANLKTVISPDEVAPKYDADYEEWKNK